ncbi:MAG: hypothetical protein QXT58_04605 [Archaeoglobaceae archaeon]
MKIALDSFWKTSVFEARGFRDPFFRSYKYWLLLARESFRVSGWHDLTTDEGAFYVEDAFYVMDRGWLMSYELLFSRHGARRLFAHTTYQWVLVSGELNGKEMPCLESMVSAFARWIVWGKRIERALRTSFVS